MLVGSPINRCSRVWNVFVCSLNFVMYRAVSPIFFLFLYLIKKYSQNETWFHLLLIVLSSFETIFFHQFSVATKSLNFSSLLCLCPMTNSQTNRFQITLCILIQKLLKSHNSTPILHPNFPLVEYLPCHEYFQFPVLYMQSCLTALNLQLQLSLINI